MESDAALVKRVLGREEAAFGTLVEKYKDAVFGAALARTGHFHDAEEIAQETFLTAFGSLGRLRHPEVLGSWLYRIAANKARSYVRADRSRQLVQQRFSETLGGDAAGQRYERDQRRALVREVLQSLSHTHRQAATLYYINGYSLADISRFVSRPVGTVKRHLYNARKRLRKELLTMMSNELKDSRPGREFTDTVMRKVKQARIYVGRGQNNCIQITDAKGRVYEMPIGQRDAEAVRARLEKVGREDGIDLHKAILGLLREFGFSVAEVVLFPATVPNVVLRLKVKGQSGPFRTVQAEYCSPDGLALAIQTGADVLVDSTLAKDWEVRGDDGKPLSPGEAWRSIADRRGRRFKNIEEVIAELERNPDSSPAREALTHARPNVTHDHPLILHKEGAMQRLVRWAKAKKGTEFEGLAEGLLGAVYLQYKPDKAVAHLERAQECRPEDKAGAFDLATAYCETGDPEKALGILERYKPDKANACNNFKKLWNDPRFVSIAGDVDHRYSNVHYICQTGLGYVFRSEGSPATKSKRFEFTRKIAAAGRELADRLAKSIGQGLLEVRSVTVPLGKEGGEQYALLICGRNLPVGIPLPAWFDARHLELVTTVARFAYCVRARSEGALALLSGSGIRIETVVLREIRGNNLVADLIAAAGRRTEQVSVDGLDAICLALPANKPVFIAPDLADKLAVCGKTGKPLTPTAALRTLRAAKTSRQSRRYAN